jgi:lysophospholipase L1-like esterase/chitodextrinase
MLGLLALLLSGLSGLLSTTATPQQSLAAPIGLVGNIGAATHANGTPTRTLRIAVRGAIAAGHTIVITAGSSGTGVVVQSVRDARGNIYHVDRTTSNDAASIGTSIVSAYVAKGLARGGMLTITFNRPATMLSAVASEWRGIERTHRLDRTAARLGTSRSLGSGTTARTSTSGELLIGSFTAASSGRLRAGSGYTALAAPPRGHVGEAYETQLQAYRLGAARGAHDASALSTLAVPYAAAIATYRTAASPTALALGPAPPTNLATTARNATSVSVSWTASSGESLSGYGLYRNGSRIGTVKGTAATFSGLACGTTYTLGVDAFDSSGRRSKVTSLTASTASCSSAPTIAITAPANGSTVSGTVVITANASDDQGVLGVQFTVDGVPLGPEDTTAPYGTSWNTTTVSGGNHVLSAVARDAAGNTTTAAAVTAFVSNRTAADAQGPQPMPVISRNAPAFASTLDYAPSQADDASYDTYWRSTGVPAWLAYDLSAVPPAHRGRVLVSWYNDPITSPFEPALIGQPAYNIPGSYTIQASAEPSGPDPPPEPDWVTLATVTGNTYHSRQLVVDMTGYNWIRMDVTASDGSATNFDAAFNMDVHDASAGVDDSWIFLGDSITMDGMNHDTVSDANVGNFSQLINAAKPEYFPSYEDGGIAGLLSADGAANIARWLQTFPGHYVTLNYGTNDANACFAPSIFYANYVTMVKAVLALGKIPIVPTIPASQTPNVQRCGPGLNAQIQNLYAAYPQIVRGPDLWAFFTANPGLISSDALHPSDAGYAAMRQQWASAMLSAIYH